jgi:hypothetical protein
MNSDWEGYNGVLEALNQIVRVVLNYMEMVKTCPGGRIYLTVSYQSVVAETGP